MAFLGGQGSVQHWVYPVAAQPISPKLKAWYSILDGICTSDDTISFEYMARDVAMVWLQLSDVQYALVNI